MIIIWIKAPPPTDHNSFHTIYAQQAFCLIRLWAISFYRNNCRTNFQSAKNEKKPKHNE